MRRITSALYLDFDNIFSRLLVADRAAAMVFVGQPEVLIDRLHGLDGPGGAVRDVLVRRVYLNPNGTIPDPSDESIRLPISEFRSPFTQAGFEVIDCPRLARGVKNGADIRMVIDVMDVLAGPVRFDEVILGSSDADFTPLLIKLRSNDRRTMLLTTGSIADAYGSAADRRIGEAELIGLLAPRLALVEPKPAQAGSSQPERQAARALVALVNASAEPVALSAAGLALRREVGTELVTETRWFGRRTLTRFVQERVTNLKADSTSVWNPARHAAPKPITA